MSRLQAFLAELKRRRVYRVAVTYVVVGLGTLGAAELTLDPLGLGALRPYLVMLVFLGFPLALVLAWAYDITPDGGGRTDEMGEGTVSTVVSGPVSAERVESARAARSFDAKAIAVLPFANLSDERENEFFSDGVTEEILMHLSKIGDLHVISRTSVMVYKGTAKPLREIATELEVGSVLEGSVRRAGGRVRVTAQLIEAATDKHLWAETYDRGLADIFGVQSDVAEKIAGALKAELAPGVAARIRARPTENLEAHDLLLLGRRDLYRIAAGDVERAIERFRQAAEMDPNFAEANAMLAIAYNLRSYYAGGLPRENFRTAREAAGRALASDPDRASAWVAEGMVKYHLDWDWVGAEADLDRAIVLDPNSAQAHFWRGHLCRVMLRHDEAIHALQTAASLDPAQTVYRVNLAVPLFKSGRRTHAVSMVFDLIESDPEYSEGHMVMGWFLLETGRPHEAIGHLEQAMERTGRFPFYTGLLAMAHDDAGELAARDRLLDELDSPAGTAQGVPMGQTLAALVRGDLDTAGAYLEAWVEGAYPGLLQLRSIGPIHQRFVRSDEYRALMGRIFSEAP